MPTNIYFGETSEGKVVVRVDEDFVVVTQALRDNGWAGFTRQGTPVTVNARNVLWVEEHRSSAAAGFH